MILGNDGDDEMLIFSYLFSSSVTVIFLAEDVQKTDDDEDEENSTYIVFDWSQLLCLKWKLSSSTVIKQLFVRRQNFLVSSSYFDIIIFDD